MLILPSSNLSFHFIFLLLLRGMSRRSSCSSLSQKNQPREESVAHDIEEIRETTHVSSVSAHITASHSAEYSSSLHYEKPVSKSTAPPPPAVVAPDSNELKYITPPEVQPPASKPKTAPLPMPAAQPEKVNNPQMAFDFNGRDFNKVVARPLNMEQRDEHEINQDLKTHFLDIFGEPDPQYHSIACVWTTSYRVFEITRIYCYKILTLIFGLPIALIAGFIFALFTFLRIWVAQPLLTLVRMVLSQVLAIWPILLLYIVRPFFYSVGAVFSTFRLHRTDGPIIREIWDKQDV